MISERELAALAQFLYKAKVPALHRELPTFFGIAGIGHKELPLSNVYAFFFDSEEVHGLGTLFLQALLDVVERKNPVLAAEWPRLDKRVRVAREYSVDKQQRLDLLVHDGKSAGAPQQASYAVLVENKVNHWLANDLDNYMSSVRGSMRKLGVVLGPRPERPEEPWIFVAHAELARAVQQRLGLLLSKASARYLPILLQFLEHLTNMSEQNDNFTRAFDFVQQHRAQVAQIQLLLKELNAQSLSEAVATAFGEGFELCASFPNRVDIGLTRPAPFIYVVYFGHILDLAQSAGFTISLYTVGDEALIEAWRSYFQAQPLVQQTGATKLSWFDEDFPAIGKEYDFGGSSLDDFMDAVHNAWQEDWQPLEDKWVGLTEPPKTGAEVIDVA
jgi:PD-(D/E)XK nuclease superfamily